LIGSSFYYSHRIKTVRFIFRAHPRLRRGPGYPLQFLGFTCGKACGISASIPCADQRAAAICLRYRIPFFAETKQNHAVWILMRKRLKSKGIPLTPQGIGVYFQVPGNYQVSEEILTAKSNKFLFAGPFLPSFFDFAMNFFFKAYCFRGILTLKK
jgi:hypothetical protein